MTYLNYSRRKKAKVKSKRRDNRLRISKKRLWLNRRLARWLGRQSGASRRLSTRPRDNAICYYRKLGATAQELAELVGLSVSAIYYILKRDMPSFMRRWDAFRRSLDRAREWLDYKRRQDAESEAYQRSISQKRSNYNEPLSPPHSPMYQREACSCTCMSNATWLRLLRKSESQEGQCGRCSYRIEPSMKLCPMCGYRGLDIRLFQPFEWIRLNYLLLKRGWHVHADDDRLVFQSHEV